MEPDDDLDLRSTIESAMDADSEPDAGGEPEPSAPVPATPEPAAEPPAAPEASGEKVRDALGRFVPKAATAKKAPGGAETPEGVLAPVQAEKMPPGAVQAPSQAPAAPPTWSPSAREHWAQVPAPVQQEIHRREVEMQRVLGETAQARNIADRFTQTIQPFLTTIRAEGVDPFTAVANLMDVTTKLRFGTGYEKASLIAEIVKVYDIDVNALDSALVGTLPKQDSGANPQYVQQAVQQAMAPFYQAAQQRQQQMAQQAEAESRTELQAFAVDPANEFFGDLRGIMADIVEVADRQGQPISLRDAYVRAAMLHPEVSKVIIARQQGVNARQLTQAAQKAKGSAVSVRGSAPVGSPNGHEPTSIRESIEAAIESHSRL